MLLIIKTYEKLNSILSHDIIENTATYGWKATMFLKTNVITRKQERKTGSKR
jgi:hypothetical protein